MLKSTRNPAPVSTSKFFRQELYQQMSDDLHLTGKAPRTHSGYLRAVRKLAEFCHKQPDQISEAQVRRFFLHLKNELNYAYGTLRVALSGVKFFYSVTCKRDWNIFSMLKLQNVNALPEVLTIGQVQSIIEATTTERMRVFFWTVYTMGLRLNEGLHLQVGDIDADRGLVHIHRGKGAKDRYIPIPTSTLLMLRKYWVTHRHKRFLFPADGRNHALAQGKPSEAKEPMSETAVQGAMKLITKQINFGKKVSTHTLRHSYATHRDGRGECEAGYRAAISIRKAFAAIMRCRTGKLGGVQWQCNGCGRTHWTGRSCGNRHYRRRNSAIANWASSVCCIRGGATQWCIIPMFTIWFPVVV